MPVVLLYETGCSHGCHDRSGTHTRGIARLQWQSIRRRQVLDIVQEASRRRHPFMGYKRITIALLRPRLRSDNFRV
jgi:hypothetical protein